MKKTAMLPIAPENFDQCWKTIDQLRRKSRLMCAIARIGGFFSNFFLLFGLVFAANGLIWLNFQGSYPDFLSIVPGFLNLMELLSLYVLKPGDSAQIQALKLVAVVYAAAILLFILLSLLVQLIYHPLKKQIPEGTYADQTTALARAAQEARDYAYRTRLSTSTASTMITIFFVVICFLAYIIYVDDYYLITSILTIFPTQDPYVNCSLYALALYLPCGISSWLLLTLTRWIYRYDFPHDLLAQAESAALLAQEETEGLTPEEIAAQRKARAASLRDEAIELEKELGHQKAMKMLHEAALLGDIPAMEHYGRHCVLAHLDDSARYWLRKALDSGEAGKDTGKMLLRLRLHLNHNVSYLRPDAAPLTKWQQVLRTLKIIFSILLRILVLLLFIAGAAVFVLLLTDRLDTATLTDALARLIS